MGFESFQHQTQSKLRATTNREIGDSTATNFNQTAVTLGTAPLLVPFGAADTLAQSLEATKNFLVSPGGRGLKALESDVFNNDASVSLLDDIAAKVPSTQFIADEYRRNQEGFQLTGEVATLITGIGAISKGVKGVGLLGKPLTSPIGQRVFGNHTRVEKLYDDYATLGAQAARNGGIISSRANPAQKAKALEIHKALFNANPRKGKLGASLKEAISTEVLITATMNQSDLFYPEGMSNGGYAAMAGVGILAPNVIDRLVKASRLRSIDQKLGETVVRQGRETLAFGANAVTSDEILFAAGTRNSLLTGAKEGASVSQARQLGVLENTNNDAINRVFSDLGNASDEFAGESIAISAKQRDTLTDALNNDPSIALGLHSIEKYGSAQPADLTAVLQSVSIRTIDDKIDELFKVGTPDAIIKGEALKLRRGQLANTSHTGLSPEGAMFASKAQDAFDGNVTTKGQFGNDGSITFPKTKARKTSDVTGKQHRERTAVYAKFPEESTRAATEISKRGGTRGIDAIVNTTLRNGRTYLEQDWSLSLLSKLEDSVGTKKLTEVINANDAARKAGITDYASFKARLGAQRFKKAVDTLTKDTKAGKTKGLNLLDLSRQYNLKLWDGESTTPSTLGLWVREKPNQILRTRVDKLEEQFEAYSRSILNELTPEDGVLPLLELRGSSHELADKGKSVILMRDERKLLPNVNNHVELQAIAEATQAEVVTQLGRFAEMSDPLLRELGGPNLAAIALRATNDEVSDTFIRSIPDVFGGTTRATAGNDSLTGSVSTTLLAHDANFRNANVTAFGAGRQINEAVRGQYEKAAKAFIEENIDLLHSIRKKENFADLASFSIATRSFNQGWETTRGANWTNGVKLADTETNRAILKRYNVNNIDEIFAKGAADLPDITKLVQGKYAPVGITKRAGELLDFMSRAEKISLLNRNTVRGATQRGLLDEDLLSLPNTNRKFDETFVIHDAANNKVLRIVTAKNADSAFENAQRQVDELNKQFKGKQVATASRADDYKSRTGRSHVTEGFTERSANAADVPTVESELLDVMLQSIVKDWGSVSAEVINARFRKEMNFLTSMSDALKRSDSNVLTRKTRNVYDDVANITMGINTARPAGNAYFKAMNAADQLGDDLLQATLKAIDPLFSSQKRLNRLDSAAAKIGEETGYTPATDFLEKAGIGASTSAQTVARRMNAVTGFYVLRFLEAGQALLNATTIPTILPTVGKTMARRPKESFEEFRARVGWFADVIGDGGEAVTQMSQRKLMMQGIHDMWTPEGRAVMAHAKEFGFLNATVVENHDIIFDGGKLLAKPSVWQKFQNIAAKPTDFSEQYARTISYMSGYRLYKAEAEHLSENAIHKLANAFANMNTGDYSKLARPDNFQGTMGSMLGLFQTFFTNYWQRLARAVELGDTKTLKTGLGTQGAIFGLESLPGYDMFQGAWSSYDGSTSPWESMVGAYGVDYAQVLSTGTLSNIPKLWGGEGIALHTRGDTNARGIPNITQMNQVPAMMVASKLLKGSVDIAKVFKSQGVDGSSRMMEIVANSVPSRPARGAFEVLQGYATDSRGGVVEDNTRTTGSIVARLIGSKPTNEAKVGETLWRQRSAQQALNGRMETLRATTMSRIRKNGGKVTNEMMEDIFTDYYDLHRNPRAFKQWIKTLAINSRTSKADKQLLEKYKTLSSGRTTGGAREKALRELYQLVAADPDIVSELR